MHEKRALTINSSLYSIERHNQSDYSRGKFNFDHHFSAVITTCNALSITLINQIQPLIEVRLGVWTDTLTSRDKQNFKVEAKENNVTLVNYLNNLLFKHRINK